MSQRRFDFGPGAAPATETLVEGALVLRAHARAWEEALISGVNEVAAAAPFRRMQTPGGFRMSVAITNCGALGWVSDRTGYRYDALDPESQRPWPELPGAFRALAGEAATLAGFAGFDPDACLVNRYELGAGVSLHQDKNERDFSFPIVSVSLGAPAVFLFGGLSRSDKTERVHLEHGDVVVWGGPARLRYHGVLPLKAEHHPAFGSCRVNLTFRRAG